MIRLLLIFDFMLIAAFSISGCDSRDPMMSTRPKIAVSIPPHAWLVQQIAGDHVDIQTLLTPGQSPATYQPADAQITRLMQADIFFRAGVPFEQGQWFNAIDNSKKLHIIDLRRNIILRHIDDHHSDHQYTGDDPHTWLSPRNLIVQASTMTDALCHIDPANSQTYRDNQSLLDNHLREIDRQIREYLSNMPARSFFVFHPAFGYFADAYNLQQIPIEIEGKQPTDRELTELQNLARQHEIKVIFVQPQIAGQAAQAVADAVGARLEILDPIDHDVTHNLLNIANAIANSSRLKENSDG